MSQDVNNEEVVDIYDDESTITHYGILRRSGRYPWGSGSDSSARATSFLASVSAARKQGLSNAEIAAGHGLKPGDIKNMESYSKMIKAVEERNRINYLLNEKQMSATAVAKEMGLSGESAVRSKIKPIRMAKHEKLQRVADEIRSAVDEHGSVDIGKGANIYLKTTESNMKVAIAMLRDEGYEQYYGQVKQAGTGKMTSVISLNKPGTTWKEFNANIAKMHTLGSVYKEGDTYQKIKPPKSIDGKRVYIRYVEDGGADKDGIIQLRRNVPDLDLQSANYAQVRVLVDNKSYLKGMAMYADDIPEGYDIVFNTNKKLGTPMHDVLKPIKRDLDGNPDYDNLFGASLLTDDMMTRCQSHYTDAKGKKQQSALNIVREEGQWADWSNYISSQVLSKQPVPVIKEQLGKFYETKQMEFDEINALTNPVVKRYLMEKLADKADSSAVDLKAAALPNQGYHVILPVSSLKPTEVYAPNYKNGERLVLIRYPHGGTFEMPELIVNNNNQESKRIMGNAVDAIGIHPSVAQQLSGADFDGDTTLVIPNYDRNGRRILTASQPLEALMDFDPKLMYPEVEGMKYMKKGGGAGCTQMEMGKISNLISDMTIKGASRAELARAVKHSMVVIDAEKHKLDYTRSYTDQGIASLKAKYQGGSNKGSATIISRAKSDLYVDEVKANYKVDPATGKKIFEQTGATRTQVKPLSKYKQEWDYINNDIKNAEERWAAREKFISEGKATIKETNNKSKFTKMYMTEDAHTLVSEQNGPVERAYADHANRLKALGNEARRVAVNIETPRANKEAKALYANEVQSLNEKLIKSEENKPLERKAQLLASDRLKQQIAANPGIDADKIKKLQNQNLTMARQLLGAKKYLIKPTAEEWEAIQNGAISSAKLLEILNNTDIDYIKQLATPRVLKEIPTPTVDKAVRLLASGAPRYDVARALGISVSAVKEIESRR